MSRYMSNFERGSGLPSNAPLSNFGRRSGSPAAARQILVLCKTPSRVLITSTRSRLRIVGSAPLGPELPGMVVTSVVDVKPINKVPFGVEIPYEHSFCTVTMWYSHLGAFLFTAVPLGGGAFTASF